MCYFKTWTLVFQVSSDSGHCCCHHAWFGDEAFLQLKFTRSCIQLHSLSQQFWQSTVELNLFSFPFIKLFWIFFAFIIILQPHRTLGKICIYEGTAYSYFFIFCQIIKFIHNVDLPCLWTYPTLCWKQRHETNIP